MNYYEEFCGSHDELLGLEVVNTVHEDDYSVRFNLSDGRCILMKHDQDCCEDVRLVECDIDLLSVKGLIKKFEKTTVEVDGADSCCLATFYNITIGNDTFNMRWLGESNGFYSVGVSVYLLNKLGNKQ